MLVGHSWGGLYVQAFSDQYPDDVAGLVFLDVTDFETTAQEKGAAVPAADRQQVMETPGLPPVPPGTPPGVRAEYGVVGAEMTTGYPEARSLRLQSNVPVAVVVATPPGRLQGLGGAMVRLQIDHQAEWALQSTAGLFVTAGHVGHRIQRDDPALVLRMVEHVIEHGSSALGR